MAESALLRRVCPAKSHVGQTSPTPILDLLEPLPTPADEVVTGKFAFPFLTWVAIVVITQNYSFLVALLGVLPALFIAVVIHECGHLIFGWCAGLRFRGVEVGPICILFIRNKWFVRLRPRIYTGAAHMVLRRIRRIRRQLVICTLGGPVTSYLFAFLAFIVGEFYRPADSSGWTTFLEFSGFLSLIIAVFSTFPYGSQMGGNDAHILRQLIVSKTGSMQMIAAHAAHYAASVEPVVPSFFERWWKLASTHSGTLYSRYYVSRQAYRTAKDPAVAADHLEHLLRLSPWQDIQTRNFLAAEAALFTARHRPGSGYSDVWLSRTKHLDWLDPMSRIRLDIALAESRQEFTKALAACDSGLALIRANSSGPAAFTVESEWEDWKKQIEARLTPANSDVLQPANY